MKKHYILISIAALLMHSCGQRIDSDAIHLDSALTFKVSCYNFNEPRNIPGMQGESPQREKINVNSQYITKNKIPWIPTYGEFQYSRYPAQHWEDAILKMKSQGFYAISTYVFWIHHEEIEGKWNFEGRRNLRRFLKLCQKHDMRVFMRIGPWVNGECRNGGHPDWLMTRLGESENTFAHSGGGGRLRSADPEYLAAVDKLYFQLSKQMEGMYWKDGGPIFAIQLDNEYTKIHSGVGGTALIVEEKEMALKYGMHVPVYTTTAWNGAEYIQDHTIPTHGSYADYFWGKATDYYRTPAFSFSRMRAVDDIDTEVNPMDENEIYDIDEYNNNPYMTCETGIGMNIAYHRRTKISPEDNGAISLVELGSGCNGMGYYMNLGGNNPVGELSFMNRDLDEGACDNPKISNDFQGAIGEFGQIRESFYEYPAQLHFMTDFGKYLAPCQTFVPAEIDELQGKDLLNSKELQRALRTDGYTGFLFVNNHVKHDTAYQFNNVQFNITLADETLIFPEEPVNIPKGSYFYWPFNLNLSGVALKYATAQPVLYLEKSNTYVFFENEGIEASFVFNNINTQLITASEACISKAEGFTKVNIENAGLNCAIDIVLKNGLSTRFIVLNQKQAKQLYRDGNTLYLSDAEVLLFNHRILQVVSENTENTIWMYPGNVISGVNTTPDGMFQSYKMNFDCVDVALEYSTVQDGIDITFENRYYKHNPDVPNIGVPDDSIFDKGTIVNFSFPDGIPEELYDVRIKVDYMASAARFYKNDEFVYDNYYNETAWELSTSHLLKDYTVDMKLELKIIPLQPTDPIYIAGKYWPDQQTAQNTLRVKKLEAIPVYSTSYPLNR